MQEKRTHALPLQLLKEAVITFIVALVVFGPVTGLVLDGYSFESHLIRPLVLALVATGGRVGLTLLTQLQVMQPLWGRLGRISSGGVTVKTGLERPNTLLLIVLFAVGISLPFWVDKYWTGIAILALIYVLLGLGLNIVVGLAGLLDLGYVAYYAVGAYLLALGAQYLGLGFWSALVVAPFVAAFLGMVLAFPVLRMHGDYLAIVTLGFGEIIRLVLTNWGSFTGGPNGMSAPSPTFFGIEFTRKSLQNGTPLYELLGTAYNPAYRYWFLYCVLFLIVCAVIYIVNRLRAIPIGRMWEALREDEIACRSLGINHVFTKLSAFMLGASTGGIAGVFFASQQTFVNPMSFTFQESALILAIVVLGGLGSTTGVIIAAVVLTLLPEFLREFADYRMLVFGLLMVIMMIWRPRGLVHIKRPAFFPSSKMPDSGDTKKVEGVQ